MHRRVINWGDTDAANIVYTGKFFEYSLEAIEAWFRSVLKVDWYELNLNRKIGTPFVHVDMDIKAMLTPHDVLGIKVRVEKIGRSSLTFGLTGERDDGRECFSANFVCCLVSRPDNQVMAIPDWLRQPIAHYAETT